MEISGRPTTGRPKKSSYREGRDSGLYIRISGEMKEKLKRLCSYYGMTKTDFILWQIDICFNEMRRKEVCDGEKKRKA